MRKYNHKISERANESLRRRECIVRKQKTLIVAVIILLVSLGVLFGTSMNALASSKTDISSLNKYYTSIQIESGDTLWNISDKYICNLNITKAEYMGEICKLNNISEDEIQTGDYIVIPYYSNENK